MTYRRSGGKSILSSEENWYEGPGTNPGLVYSRQGGNEVGTVSKRKNGGGENEDRRADIQATYGLIDSDED